jgi:hypothetical protein
MEEGNAELDDCGSLNLLLPEDALKYVCRARR